MPKIDEPQIISWQYIAGFIDGEGSFSLTVRSQAKTPNYGPQIAIYNTNLEVLTTARNFSGIGRLYLKARVKDARYKQCYTWLISSRMECQTLCESLIPYLIVKKAQAVLMRDFCMRRALLQTRKFTEDDFIFVQEMRDLNNRSVNKGSPMTILPQPDKILELP